MTQLPSNAATQETLHEWYKVQQDLKALKIKEHMLRIRIFSTFFPEPKEGSSNKYSLDDGFTLMAKHNIVRTIDMEALTVMEPEFRLYSIDVAELIKWKPELSLKAYRELSGEKLNLFDNCIISKPGSPSLEIIPPRKKD